MKFETIERIIAIQPASVVAVHDSALAAFGEILPDGAGSVMTVAAHWDDASKTRIRAASLMTGSIAPMVLTDGRIAFRALWQSDLALAFVAGDIAAVNEITEIELQSLTRPMIDPADITPPAPAE